MSQTLIPNLERAALIQRALGKYWGFDTLRPLQGDVVEASLNNRDAVVVMPTGGGKSLCFQLPAAVTDRLTVVVSPLIALMKDQVDALTLMGLSACALNSSLTSEEEVKIAREVIDGTIRLLYVSPERLLLPATLQLLAKADQGRGVARFAIDEAHCISAWGHDFRPEFRQLRRIKDVFPGTPVQAFTATATPQVQRDIAIQLNLERPRRFIGVFDRPNLTYRVVAKDDPVKRIVEAVRRYPDEGVIVYCLSRKDTETIANALTANGVQAVAYHAGLSVETRKKVSEDFARERANTVVATIAFGMGIDRSNVRCVIHECLPKSMEGYQQETGRAGRDGLPSECVLLYNYGDFVRLKRLLSEGEPEIVAHHGRLLEEVRRFATSHQCRHKTLSEHFGQGYELAPEGCGACDVCLGGMEVLPNSSEVGRRILGTAIDLVEKGQGRSYGMGHLVAILIGSRVKSVLDRQGDQVVGFGAFAGQSSDRVTSWVHQMTDLGLLGVTEGQYPVMFVPDEGHLALSDKRLIELVENIALLAPATAKKSKSSSESLIEGVDSSLYEKLRSWRRSIASEKGVPAYVVFHDATLMRIAAVRPSSKKGLRAITGVGDRRAEEFGDSLIEIVTAHAGEAGIGLDKTLAETSLPPKSSSISPKTATYGISFRAGLPVEEIASKAGVTTTTVWGHLSTWIQSERPDSIAKWIPEEIQREVSEAMSALGPGPLRPIYEYLEGRVTYEIIRVVQSFLKNSQIP